MVCAHNFKVRAEITKLGDESDKNQSMFVNRKTLLRPIYVIQFLLTTFCMQQTTTCSQLLLATRTKGCRILKHVIKSYNSFKQVLVLLYATSL